MSVRWIATLGPDDDPSFRVGREGDAVVAEWAGLARLSVRRAREGHGPRERWEPLPGADPRRLAKVRNGLARALVRQVDGGLALHAAAVALEGRAVALVGVSGAGKSTLAAALCAFAGGTLLADDIACLARTSPSAPIVVEATEVHHALDAASLAALRYAERDEDPLDDGKWLVATRRAGEGAYPLAAIVHLRPLDAAGVAPSEATNLARVRGAAALALLAPQVPRLLVDDPSLLRAELDGLGGLCGSVPVFELARPRALDGLGATAAGLAEAVARLAPTLAETTP